MGAHFQLANLLMFVNVHALTSRKAFLDLTQIISITIFYV